MSLQRVFESARKMGVPVIVTDPAGRDPMVVLPLEQFEALAGSVNEPVSAPVKEVAKMEAPKVSSFDSEIALKEKQLEDYLLNKAKKSTDELPIEERFYIEPLEDGASI
jgi:hypothetical protein